MSDDLPATFEARNRLRSIVNRTQELTPLRAVASKAIQMAEDERSAAMDLATLALFLPLCAPGEAPGQPADEMEPLLLEVERGAGCDQQLDMGRGREQAQHEVSVEDPLGIV